ncbi:MAG TPA: metal-sensitive transcriptional regulator [Actinomycetota bacterium]|nr:metal-sensitive transcriptional regulator [Actinomycetota bacterium]
MDEKAIRDRLRRIEGQVRGLQRMIDDDAHCIDVLTQLNSVQAALRAVGLGLLDEHVRRCLRGSADGGSRGAGIEEVMTAVGRLAR